MSELSLAEVYARWHNPNCGFEKERDINFGEGNNESGTFDHAVFLNLLNIRKEIYGNCAATFHQDILRLYTNYGIFDSRHRLEPNEELGKNSDANILGICSASYLTGYYSLCRIISFYTIKNYYKRFLRIDLSTLFSICCFSNYTSYVYALFPIYLIHLIIISFTKKRFIQEKIKALIFLPILTHKYHLETLNEFYIKRMKKLYGENFVESLMYLYYNDWNHPNVIYAKGIKLE